MVPYLPRTASERIRLTTALAAGTAAATAIWVRDRAQRAEREHPPRGAFIDVDGVRLHYIERGVGRPVVLFHGNAVSAADFEVSGLIEHLAPTHRVIAFDRPGFGHSTRPRDRHWTPLAQAALLNAAIRRFGIEQAVVVGHSLGSVVAVAMAQNHPGVVRGLVLLGGYFYPSARVDVLAAGIATLPVIGDAMRYTVSALAARLFIERAVAAMFWPDPVPPQFFPGLAREMLLRPLQLRAEAEDALFMVPAAGLNQLRYRAMQMPITIIAGARDKVVDPSAHSLRLHAELGHSDLVIVPGVGHMVHHGGTGSVVAAVERMTALPASA